jgi:hypothetical protein
VDRVLVPQQQQQEQGEALLRHRSRADERTNERTNERASKCSLGRRAVTRKNFGGKGGRTSIKLEPFPLFRPTPLLFRPLLHLQR